ncbi:hypothetical protein ACVBEH_12065, partial [Roseateles sp. GG27B]
MNTSVAPHDDALPRSGSFSHWLAGQIGLTSEAANTLLSLVEPLNTFAAVKLMVTGRYVFASPGLDQLLERPERS